MLSMVYPAADGLLHGSFKRLLAWTCRDMSSEACKVTGPVTEVYMDSAALAYLVVRVAKN